MRADRLFFPAVERRLPDAPGRRTVYPLVLHLLTYLPGCLFGGEHEPSWTRPCCQRCGITLDAMYAKSRPNLFFRERESDES